MTTVWRLGLLAGLCVGVAAWAADPPAGDLRTRQTQNAEQFRLLRDQLLKLAQKLDVSDKPAEKERAKVIRASLDLAARENVDGQFRALAGELAKDGQTVSDLDRAIGQDGQLQKALQDMLALLLTDDEAVRIKAEMKRLAEFLKEAKDVQRAEETLRALTDNPKTDAKAIAAAQAKLAERTQALADRMAGDKKPADPKVGGKSESKNGKDKDAGDPKNKDGKRGDPKSSDDKKGGDPKADEAGQLKDADPMGSKAAGEPKDGKPGEPKDGCPKAGTPKTGEPKDGKPQDSSEQQDPPPAGPPAPGRQRIQQAVPQQKGAADDLKGQKRPDAGKKQDKAIDEIAKAIQELEKRLRQLREEEAMRQLAGLEARCNRMAQLQQAVNDATKAIDAGVQQAGGQKTTADIQKAQAQADKEREIVTEADKTLDLLKAEGSAVAFAGVLREVREDMVAVQRRLTGADVGPVTQEVEANILALLKEMAAALKKQQQEMQQQQQQPQATQSGPPPNQALVNLIAELKLLLSLQERLNSQTKLVGGKAPGEQAADPSLAADLRALAARQARIEEMISALATGANK